MPTALSQRSDDPPTSALPAGCAHAFLYDADGSDREMR